MAACETAQTTHSSFIARRCTAQALPARGRACLPGRGLRELNHSVVCCSHYATDDYGNTLPDFSYVGFRGGGVPLPSGFEVPVRATVAVGDDAQAAIDTVAALPLDASGYRGAVLLLRGQHPVTAPLVVSASGIVLRGEGAGRVDGTVLVGVGPFARNDIGYEDGVPIGEPAAGGAPPVHTAKDLSSGALVQFVGESGVAEAAGATAVPILDSHVPLGERKRQSLVFLQFSFCLSRSSFVIQTL